MLLAVYSPPNHFSINHCSLHLKNLSTNFNNDFFKQTNKQNKTTISFEHTFQKIIAVLDSSTIGQTVQTLR